MIFCEHCFRDKEIAAKIRFLSKDFVGECPICHSEDSHLYDSSSQNELTPYFEDLLSVYSPTPHLPSSYPRAETKSLIDELQDRWNIFADISRTEIYNILISICKDSSVDIFELFDSTVGIPQLHDESYLREHALLKNYNWNSFVNELKTQNRFHSKLLNSEILYKYCSYIRKKYTAGQLFYRARLSDKAGYSVDNMSAPPPGQSSEGRANARGIVCLYLSDHPETTLHEVRATMFDYVSVGTFRLKQDIVVVDLRAISAISPFVFGFGCLEHAINKQYLVDLNNEMSKSLRRSDSTLDYVPTQYIADLIKSFEHNDEHEYDGIEYNSTTYPGGYNLAIFNPNLFECISVSVLEIDQLRYSHHEIQET